MSELPPGPWKADRAYDGEVIGFRDGNGHPILHPTNEGHLAVNETVVKAIEALPGLLTALETAAKLLAPEDTGSESLHLCRVCGQGGYGAGDIAHRPGCDYVTILDAIERAISDSPLAKDHSDAPLRCNCTVFRPIHSLHVDGSILIPPWVNPTCPLHGTTSDSPRPRGS